MKNSNSYSFYDWFIPIFYIFAQYGYGFLNVGTILLISYTIYSFIKVRNWVISKPLLFFTFVISFIQITNMLFRGYLEIVNFNTWIMPLISLLIVFTAINKINYNRLYIVYKYVGILSMIILYFQWFMYMFLNIIPTPVKILPESTDIYYNFTQSIIRPSSLFSEPQAYASFMIPLLVMALEREKKIFSLFIILSIFFSGSTLGIFLCSFISIYYIFLSKRQILTKISIVFFILSVGYFWLYSEYFSLQQAKINSINFENDIRIIKGFQIFSTFNSIDILFGIGDGAKILSDYNSINHIKLGTKNIFDYSSYITTVSNNFVSYGLIGGVMFLWMMIRFYKYEDKTKRLFLFVIIIASFGQTLLFNGFFLMYYITYLGICNKSENSINYIT